jgi:hypothetical protein
MVIDQVMVDDMNRIADFLFRLGKLKSKQAIVEWIDTAPLRDDYSGYGRVDYTYTGSANTLYDRTSPFHRRSGYSLVNLRVGSDKDVANHKWGASLFVDNVFDKIAETGLPVAISADLPTTRRLGIVRPRTIGLTFSYRM